MMLTHVHFALFKPFKGDPTLLLLGSPSAFASLAKRLETAQLQPESTISDADLGATGHRGFSLLLRSAEEGSGVMLDPARPLVIEWLVSPSAKQQVVQH